MDIEDIRTYYSPNIFSLRYPIVKMKVKLGNLADVPTKDIKGLNEKLIGFFPGISDHKCSTGYVGGFVDRLKEGTYLAHVAEHLCLEVQRMMGDDLKYGKARQVENDIYNVIFSCINLEVGRACGLFAINTLNALIGGKTINLDEQIRNLRTKCLKYTEDPSKRTIVREAEKRGIPVSTVGESGMVRLGYGKYQKLVSAALFESTNSITTSHILDMIYPEGSPGTIPIVSVTGTNGKTTTTRMISKILRECGNTVGMTSTQGIYVNDNCLEAGDATGPRSARRILNNREADAAVLETARGGILREGLAYEKADVAVFTNLTGDHLGIDGIGTMEDLLHVKSLVIGAIKENGACVLNADDPWVMKAMEKAKGSIVLFSLDDNNTHIINHISNGGSAVYRKGDGIFASNKGFNRKIIDVSEIPATLNGGLKHNIYNSIAAISACYALGISFENIKKALKGFTCGADINPGRFNIYDLEDFKVVLDYGHNIDGYRFTIDGLRSLNPSRLIGVIAVPGDRKDADIFEIGELSGKSFDYIIIKEDRDLRGRRRGEVADILLSGIMEGGNDGKKVQIILDEESALRTAMLQAVRGDVIIVFFEKMEPLIDIINSFDKNPLHQVRAGL